MDHCSVFHRSNGEFHRRRRILLNIIIIVVLRGSVNVHTYGA